MKPRDYVYWFALALFLLPGVFAEPEVRPESEATVFVNGAIDYLEIPYGYSQGIPASITVTAPDNSTWRFLRGEAVTDQTVRVYLDGSSSHPGSWDSIEVPTFPVPADGTWGVMVSGLFNSNSTTAPNAESPVVLAVQGRQISFSTSALDLVSQQQFWNWHRTFFAWGEPSHPITEVDPPNEAPEEDPQFFRFFGPGPSLPQFPDDDPRAFTADSTVTCPGTLEARGAWSKGLTQSQNTFGRFWFLDGFQPATADLSLIPEATSTTITDLGAGANGTHNATGFYNGVAGTSYQFEARNGTTGEWQKGLTLYAPPLQCTQPDLPDLADLEHDEGALQIQTSGGDCRDQRVVLNVMLDKPLLGGEMFDVFVANASSGIVVAQFNNANFNVDPGDVNWFNSFAFPAGEYVAIVLADLQGTPAYDHFDSYPVSVSPENCVVTFSDQNLQLTVDLLVGILENATNTNDGALLVNNMDFETLGFDGFLFFLLFAGFMVWALYNGWLIPALMGLIAAVSLFYASFPISGVGAIFLCLLSLWLQWWMNQRLEKQRKVI